MISLLDLMVHLVEQTTLVVRHVRSRLVVADCDSVVMSFREFSPQSDVVDLGGVLAVVGGKVQGQVMDRVKGDDSEITTNVNKDPSSFHLFLSLCWVLYNPPGILGQLKLLIGLSCCVVKGHLGTVLEDPHLTRMGSVVRTDYYDPLELHVACEGDVEEQLLVSITGYEFREI